ncbi:hypothetical protein ES708_24225 [subsurface metagenome]
MDSEILVSAWRYEVPEFTFINNFYPHFMGILSRLMINANTLPGFFLRSVPLVFKDVTFN